MTRTVIVAGLCALSACGRPGSGHVDAGPPPPSVVVVPVERRAVPVHRMFTGVVDGFVNAEIRARVAGFLREQNYEDGAFVKEGELLFSIDPREFAAALAEAEARLAGARAELKRAALQTKRLRPLAQKEAVSQQDLDDAVARELEAAATVAAALATRDRAQLELSYTDVRSPVDGIAGAALVRVGNLVGKNEPTLLTTVSQVDPARVHFQVTEQEYLRFAQRPDPDAGPPSPTVVLRLADGANYRYEGEIRFADRQLDPTTGTLQIDALFPNPDHLLRPGQYARIIATPRTLPDALVVPQSALQDAQGTTQVLVVGHDGVVQARPITRGPEAGPDIVVEGELEEGDQVVVEGLGVARPGTRVNARVRESREETQDGGTGQPQQPPRPEGRRAR